MRTKTDEALADALEAHADDPERATVIVRARAFKSSWIELAESLTSVKKSGRWKDWGYDSFEAYTKGELHLRQETVDKLTGSFLFLKKRAPDVLERDGVQQQIPSYAAIDFLRRAEEKAPREATDAIYKRVIEEGAPVTAVAKQYKDVVFPIESAERKDKDAAAIRNVATRLRELLAETRAVPRKLASDVGASLEQLLEAVTPPEKEKRERAA
jgi:hypothetical protein